MTVKDSWVWSGLRLSWLGQGADWWQRWRMRTMASRRLTQLEHLAIGWGIGLLAIGSGLLLLSGRKALSPL